MFGYILPAQALLDEDQQAQYKAAYCGVCKALGQEHGFWARMLLSYDFTFLALILTEKDETFTTCYTRCPARLGRKICACKTNERFTLVADLCIILTYHKLADDVYDDGFFRSLPSRFLRRVFTKAYLKASARHGSFDTLAREELDRLRQMEQDKIASIDRPADAFAHILKAAASDLPDEKHRRVAEQMLYHLGRWIYLIDAWDDLPDDLRHHRYNPVIARFGVNAEEDRNYFQTTLLHSRESMVGAYQLWEFNETAPLLEAVILGGMETVETLVLDRKWNTRRIAHERSL